MSSQCAQPDEDPLTAALPPTTDYITYLTILEYRLKPHNLHVLNGILDRDDGTLAKEIGWDLLRLVLPMLPDAPNNAVQCLDIIARRGNPREVVVRVAEELEKLGRLDDENDDNDVGSDDDGLPTFSGEASRIHLGQMKLDGMPDAGPSASSIDIDGKEANDTPPAASNATLEALQFPALLAMLSTVHPRIKTQYPSRFLATSLPAALAAYRRMPIAHETTTAFVQCLEGLGSKQQPVLPPRKSTGGPVPEQSKSATLPDPEAPAEASEGTNIASQSEKNIMTRLLQAVLLEVLDEYAASWQESDIPSMLWAKNLREGQGGKVAGKMTGKMTVTELSESAPLKERNILMQRFLKLTRTLELDLNSAVKESDSSPAEEHAEEQPEEPSEYPTSPSQIPLSRPACLLLLAAEGSAQNNSSPPLGFADVLSLFQTVTPLSDMPSVPSPSVQDALHSLLYGGNITWTAEFVDSADSTTFTELMSILTQTFTISPDAQSRDDAHFIAQTLFRARTDVNDRVGILKQTIQCSTPPLDGKPPVPLATPFTEGALRAVGVNWLKDSIISFITAGGPNDEATGINPSRLDSDRRLNELVWHPSIPAPTDTHLLSTVLLALPYYTALLNLSNVLTKRLSLTKHPSVLENSSGLLQNLEPWRDHLVWQLSSNEEAKSSAPEIYSFEDAVLRVKDAITAKQTST